MQASAVTSKTSIGVPSGLSSVFSISGGMAATRTTLAPGPGQPDQPVGSAACAHPEGRDHVGAQPRVGRLAHLEDQRRDLLAGRADVQDRRVDAPPFARGVLDHRLSEQRADPTAQRFAQPLHSVTVPGSAEVHAASPQAPSGRFR